MTKYYWENVLFPQFLMSVDSCTISELANFEVEMQLNNLALRAITDFKFPNISLEYDFDTEVVEDDTFFKYYFKNEITQREINVILARMKQHWVEYQISQERLFMNIHFDKDIRLHSPGNTIDKLVKMLRTFQTMADTVEYNYGRVSNNGRPSIGDVNKDE